MKGNFSRERTYVTRCIKSRNKCDKNAVCKILTKIVSYRIPKKTNMTVILKSRPNETRSCEGTKYSQKPTHRVKNFQRSNFIFARL